MIPSQTQNWISILQNENQNGIVILVAAFLFTLSMYHFLLYFQHKDKAYLLYSLYTFIVFVYTYYRAEDFFLTEFSSEIIPYIVFLADPIKWLYTTIYILFAVIFVDLYRYYPKWNRFFTRFVILSLVSVSILTVISIVQSDNEFIKFGYNFIYLPIAFPLSVVLLYLVAKTNSPVKYYILIGSGVFLFVSTYSHYLTYTERPFRVLFYFSIIFETVFFALGLGAKQKTLLEDKNAAQEAVIAEHKINIALQERIKTQLDKEVAIKTNEILALTKTNQEEEKRKLEIVYAKRTLDLRMRALQTQMNPHFLFNSLNSIKHFIITNKKEDAAYFLSKLSKLLRKILDNSQLKEITLQEELNIMQLYLEVENIRLQKTIDFNIVVAPDIYTTNIHVPPLVLQPFIENAIWHGLALKKGDKKIEIKIETKKDAYLISIIDNGIGREKSAMLNAARLVEKESLGIDLTRERLEAYTEHLEGKVSITFEDLYKNDKPAGTKVLLYIPIS